MKMEENGEMIEQKLVALYRCGTKLDLSSMSLAERVKRVLKYEQAMTFSVLPC